MIPALGNSVFAPAGFVHNAMRNAKRTSFALSIALLLPALPLAAGAVPAGVPVDPRETHLADLVQLTSGGENAEAYWSPDGRELVFQATRPPYSCDQIFRVGSDGKGDAVRVSNGEGRTTCAYFTADGKRILYSSTHHAGAACPAPPDRSQGYVWPVNPDFEIYSTGTDGSGPVRLTRNDAYDAEATVCPADGSVIFTSTRDGDLDLYRMDSDGGNVRRLTRDPGYDGGAFFSPDCSKIVWRASRPAAPGEPAGELASYRRLLAQRLVRPTRLEIWVADADGGNARQVTHLGVGSFAPSFFPSGRRILFSSNYGDPKGREFDLWAVDVDGGNLERITWTPGFDGFPLFSPDGTRLAFSSNRVQSAPGETNVFVARWVDGPAAGASEAEKRLLSDVRWLADDLREGRGVGTRGREETAAWIERRFRELGIEPAGESGGYLQSFDAPVSVAVGPGTAVSIDGKAVPGDSLVPASFAAEGTVEGEILVAGHGITAPELGIDDYKGLSAEGKIVVVRRFAKGIEDPAAERRYGDLRYKAWNAREHGARALIVVDLPEVEPGREMPEEASLPVLRVDSGMGQLDAGIPVVHLKRDAGRALFEGARRASVAIDLDRRTERDANVLGVIRAGPPGRLPGGIVIGAHYDHIGLGSVSSLTPDVREVHNGADDNASGTAALLEIARQLASRRNELRRDVYLAAFSGEEIGVLGSTAFTRRPPAGLDVKGIVAMLNMDMVGRLRGNALLVQGAESAEEWADLMPPLCERAGLACALGGDGYGPSDHYPFYAAGVPVLHFFTSTHEDYHRPSDDVEKVNIEGTARIAGLVAETALKLSSRAERLSYKSAAAPVPQGDARSSGAALGLIPDYAGDGRRGLLLSGVRPGGGAEKAGLRRGDLIVELAGAEIRDIHDVMFVLRRSKPGETAKAVILRGQERIELDVTFGVSPGAR